MNEQDITQSEHKTLEACFADELSDEALDRPRVQTAICGLCWAGSDPNCRAASVVDR